MTAIVALYSRKRCSRSCQRLRSKSCRAAPTVLGFAGSTVTAAFRTALVGRRAKASACASSSVTGPSPAADLRDGATDRFGAFAFRLPLTLAFAVRFVAIRLPLRRKVFDSDRRQDAAVNSSPQASRRRSKRCGSEILKTQTTRDIEGTDHVPSAAVCQRATPVKPSGCARSGCGPRRDSRHCRPKSAAPGNTASYRDAARAPRQPRTRRASVAS